VLGLDQSAKDFLIEKGYNPDFGARPLRRAIAQYMEDPLSESLLSGEFQGNNKILVSVADMDASEEDKKLNFRGERDPEIAAEQERKQKAKEDAAAKARAKKEPEKEKAGASAGPSEDEAEGKSS
jgi:ATP-dependent Clp protease ATP-binding subunit ClpC